MNLRFRSLGLPLITLGLVGCEGAQTPSETVPVTHASAAVTAEQNTERALRGLIDSSGHLAESKSLARLLTSLAGSSMSCSSSAPVRVCEVGAADCVATEVEESCVEEANEVTQDDLMEARSDLHQFVDDLVALMRDEIFVDANLESDDGKTVIYKLGPDVFCDDSNSEPLIAPDSDVNAATPASTSTASATTTTTTINAPEYDPECVADLEKWAPRIKLVAPREGDIDLTLLLTDQRISPLTLNLYQHQVGAKVDLGAIKAASDRAGTPMEGVSALAGVISASLVENGALNYSLDVSVTEMVKMVLGDQPEKFTITLAPSPKAVTLNIDGNSGHITGRLDVSSFTLSAPLGAFMDDEIYADESTNSGIVADPAPPKAYRGTIEGFLAGIQGNFAHDKSSDVCSLTNFGFGSQASYVKHDGVTLVSLDVNATEGRVFDLYVDGSGDGSPSLQFSPGLDVDVLLGFSAIADQVTDFKQFMLNDRLKLTLSGEKPTIGLEDQQLRVVSGAVELRSEMVADYRTVVAAGMCLVDANAENTPQSLVGEFAANTCQ